MTTPPNDAERRATLIELLSARAADRASSGFTFLVDGEREERHMSFAELDRRARAIAVQLQRMDAFGKRALLLYPPGLDYIAGMFGCAYAGAVSVPVALPDARNAPSAMPRLAALAAEARPTLMLTTTPILDVADLVFGAVPELRGLDLVATDEIAEHKADAWTDPGVEGSSVALLHGTSGSAASPKGTLLTHENLLEDVSLIRSAFAMSEESRVVSWLTPYHDMGLVGAILATLHAGSSATLFSPSRFLKRPLRWLEAISRTRATVSGGPSFAYDLCVRATTPEERARLDLSHWKVAFTGGEPIRPDALARFVEAFAPSGFRAEAFYPCRGPAEQRADDLAARFDARFASRPTPDRGSPTSASA